MAKRQIREYVFTPGIAGVGKIKVLDKINLDTVLLITNVTKNKILYNFSDPTNRIAVAFRATTDGSDPDFPYANTISNGVTEFTLLFDTSDQSSTDALQIFVENEELRFRPYDFGTDAIERMRVATPQSMLDADFEYGLQPTKWQTIDMMRGYPSIYEVPGSELNITDITTDASSSTGGIGDSLITVVTPQVHGFSVGTPVRIFGLNDSITGNSRAEGSFIVDSVGTTTSFSYYAKGKVGTTNGQSLRIASSQLRRGDYYTGSSIANPTFSVSTQGSNGSFLTNLVTLSGSNRISFIGVSTAQVGAPLTASGIPTGSQITGITTTSTTKTISQDIISPTNTIVLSDVSGVEVGASINNGIGTATFVSNIAGSTLTLTSPMFENYSVGTGLTFFPSITMSEPTTTLISAGSTVSFASIAKIQVSFPSKHGLVPGDTILVSIGSAGSNHQLASGPRTVEIIPDLNRIIYSARSPGTVAAGLAGTVYTRPDCFYIHRPFDGGVQLGTGGPAHGAHAIRQSKKYIRYQSGKGIMYTTGTLFAPAYDLRSVTATGISTGSVITVVTDDTEHGLQVGAEIILNGVTTSGYNGNYVVFGITNETTFTVLATQQLGSTTATLGTPAQVSLYKWKGATVRAGAFDDQNGIFWQYDGINLAVGLRSATFQLAGTIAINTDSNTVTGTNTRFREQLIVGNRIVIRGMTHVVADIQDNTTMTVTPDFRGVSNVSGVKAALVNEIIIPQSQWNIDRADGTGSSGYHLEVNKMQMIGFQYTWYGAGFIDWMLRGPNGDYLFVHRLKNNNRNTEAFMRSGNLPVRYEVINEGARTKLTQNVGIGSTQIFVDNINVLPSSGSLYIDNEIINYSGIQTSTSSLVGITRSGTFSNFYSGSQRSYTAGVASTHSSGTGIVLLSNTATPVISHWGSAFLTDGLFDSDRGYIFNYQSVSFPVSTTKTTAFLIRLAPSVSNAIVGDLGERELINRAQLLLQGIEFTPTGGTSATSVVIEGILNPQNYPTNPSNISWFSLTSSGAGGQPSFAQIANGNSVTWVGAVSPIIATNSTTQTSRTTSVIFGRAATSGVRVGMGVTATGLAGGTTVVGITNFDASNVTIQLSSSIIPGSAGATSFTFSSPVAALPGETVFSFVGDATQKSTLDLTQLKELNNTPIGGRGAFPNGPDVLAINVYTTGASLTGTIALRWGEAQA